MDVCGRFSLAYEDWGTMLDYFAVQNAGFVQPPRYNVAPGQQISAIIDAPGGRRIGLLKWGLIPGFAKDAKSAMQSINARLETVNQKPMFKRLVSRKRCLIPADGFFEWKRTGTSKEPYRMTVKDRPFFGFAGLYDTWVSPEGERISTCLILTTTPNALMAPIHNRMPVILSREGEDMWLDSSVSDGELACSLLGSYSSDEMTAYRVASSVGNVRNDSPECIAPLQA